MLLLPRTAMYAFIFYPRPARDLPSDLAADPRLRARARGSRGLIRLAQKARRRFRTARISATVIFVRNIECFDQGPFQCA